MNKSIYLYNLTNFFILELVVIKQDNIMNREFTHKTWRYELEKIPREHHWQLEFKDWILPDDFIFFTLSDWIEYSGARIGV